MGNKSALTDMPLSSISIILGNFWPLSASGMAFSPSYPPACKNPCIGPYKNGSYLDEIPEIKQFMVCSRIPALGDKCGTIKTNQPKIET